MKISMHTMAVDSFVPMLTSLSDVLDKGAAFAAEKKLDLAGARLAPDMYPLVEQVQHACNHAAACVARLTGKEPPKFEATDKTIADLKARIAATIATVKGADPSAFNGAEERDCSIPIPTDMVIAMNGLEFLRAWALPNFYFHLVTAYDIVRHQGAAVGKIDYLSQVGGFIKPKA